MNIIAFALSLGGPDILILLLLALIVAALIDCLISRRSIGGKLLWVAVILCAPFLGAVIYLIIGRVRK